MKKTTIAERFQRFLGGLKRDRPFAAEREPTYFSRRDAAVLKVAMMVAALDGAVTDAELAAFEKQARKCRGYNAQSAKELFRDGLRSAGYLELASRTLTARELLAAFLEEAKSVLSDGFARDDVAGIRSAFVIWVAMAMSDGEYSAIERKAITTFATYVTGLIDERRRSNRERQSMSPAFAVAYREDGPDRCVLTPGFFARLEPMIARLDRESTAAAAAADLKNLIANG